MGLFTIKNIDTEWGFIDQRASEREPVREGVSELPVPDFCGFSAKNLLRAPTRQPATKANIL